MAWNFRTIKDLLTNNRGIKQNGLNSMNYQYLIDKPSWYSLSNPSKLRQAVEENPVVNGCITILAQAAANGKKYLVDNRGDKVSWDSNKQAVKSARKLFLDRPNPLNSPFEFDIERYYYLTTFGNNYIYANNPTNFDTDILTVQTLFNLNSEFVEIEQTGKLYDQTTLEGIIDKYVMTNYSPVKEFETNKIIHFNELNISGIGNGIIGTSRLESISKAITNLQLAFEAMNVLLKHRGMQGIIKSVNKDGQGTNVPLDGILKDEIDDKFKEGYGILGNQKQFLMVNSDVEYIRTVMNSNELGIYEDFSKNTMIVTNGLGVPHELYKVWTQGSTFDNQSVGIRRMYQDRVIPLAENDDKIFTERLNFRKYGLELKTSFEHVPALQESFKEEAHALSMNVKSANLAWADNQITRNQYLEIIGLPFDNEFGELKKYEYEKEINAEGSGETKGEEGE